MRQISLAIMGFGNVGQAFAELLIKKQSTIKKELDLEFIVTGIYTQNHGTAINSGGVNLSKALEFIHQGIPFTNLSEDNRVQSAEEFINNSSAEFFVECTPLNPHDGQPALSYNKIALNRGKHVVTANKGPVVYGFNELSKLAKDRNKGFYFESAVMDGAPIFSLFRESLPLLELKGFTGILNSCTNYLLDLMSEGLSLEEATIKAQKIGITETDPSADIDGWDAAIKLSAIATVIMGIPLTPHQVDRQGIREITPAMIEDSKQKDEKWKLVCTAKRHGNRITTASVQPQSVKNDSPLYHIAGTSSFVEFETEFLPGLGIIEKDPSPITTAYGLFADIVNIYKKYYTYR
ncbi:MAG TPA: homoserine dehydrogenase [Anaerolineaceae bacterium]|nr:homoserine dehydrogenase [Anaerolineaceae bacterium]